MSWFSSGYKYDDDGYITGYNQSDWDSFWGKTTEDEQRYAAEYNQALKQYNQQYALQQAEFALNKDNLLFNQNLATQQLGMQQEMQVANLANMKFNQNLATQQQALSEESYRSGVLNQARQLQQLGINPASQGGSISGLSMQGGSNVANASAGSASQVSGVSGRSVNGRGAQYQASKIQRQLLQAQLMAAMMDYAQKANQLRVSKQDADTRSYMAQTDRMRQQVDASKLPSEIDSYELKNEYQRLLNADVQLSNDQLHAIGLSRDTISSWRGINPFTAGALGVTSVMGNVVKKENWADLSDEEIRSIKAEVDAVVERADSYEELAPGQKSAVDRFFEDYPEVASMRNYIPASTLQEWKRDGYSDTAIYNKLKNFYGV